MPDQAMNGASALRSRASRPRCVGLEPLEHRRLLAGDGLTGQYFDHPDFSGPAVLTRVDPQVNFDWGQDAPAPAIAPDTFSVRWTGQVMPAHTEVYTFTTSADDGVRLWVDGQLLIDDWNVHLSQESSGSITLIGGTRYDIRLEYFDEIDDAIVQLEWESASQAREIIPQSRLYSMPVGAIIGATLFDADIDEAIGPLAPGMVIDLSQLPTKNLSIRADFAGLNVESVLFSLNNALRVENSAPFMLYGNNEANIYPWRARTGDYTLVATPFSLDEGLGAEGTSYSIQFSVIDPEVPPPPPSRLYARAVSDRDVTLSWTDHSGGGADFAVERSLDGVNFIEIGTTGHTLFTDSSLLARTRYHYRVKAFNSAGESAYARKLGVRTDRREVPIAGFPSADDTGPTDRSVLVPRGSFTITQDNAVVENFYATGQVTVAANNVTIRNFVIEAGNNVGIKIASSDVINTLIEDGEITGPGSTNGVSGSNYTARRLHVHHMGSDAFRVYRNVVIEGCYVHDLGLAPEAHGDGVQMYPTDGGNITIVNNHIDARGGNAALFQVNGGWVVGGNYLNGGNYTIQAGGEIGNKFVNNTFGHAAKYGPIRVHGDEDVLLWVGNVWADTGEVLLL